MKRRKKGLRILAAVTGGLILLGLAAGIESVFGGPVSCGISRSLAGRYLAAAYPGQTLEFEIAHEMGAPFSYRCDVQSPDSPDTQFHVTLEKLRIVNDDYDYWVAGRRATQKRLAKHLEGDIAEALKGGFLQEEVAEQLDVEYGVVTGTASWTMDNPFKEQLPLDMPYDKTSIAVPTMLHLTLGTKEPTEEHLIEILQKLKARMKEKGLRVDYYTVSLKQPGEINYDPITLEHQKYAFVTEFPASEIQEEGMVQLLSAHRLAQEAENEAGYAAEN